MLVGGSACTDFSAFGSSQQQCGPTMVFLLLFIRLIAEYQPEVFIHENVPQFPTQILQDCLHDMYTIEEDLLSPESSGSGFPIVRHRKYITGRLNAGVTSLVRDCL